MRRRHLLAAAAALAAAPARAEDPWPSRSVSIIVPFAPGSSSDIVARAAALQLQQTLGKPFVVENRPGATGGVGAAAIIRSAPDGHLLLHAPISTWAINVALRPNLPYDPETQLTRLSQTVRTPNVLVVHPGSIAATDLPGVLAWLRSHANSAAYSTSGAGSSDHLTMEMFRQRTNTEITHIPFTGGGPAATALLGGTVQLSFQNLGSIIQLIRDGRVRPILITAAARSPQLPDVPTAAEAGLADFVVYSWQALGGPPGMAPALAIRIQQAFAAALREGPAAQRLGDLGFEVVASTPDDFATFQRGEIRRWQQVVRAGNITAD